MKLLVSVVDADEARTAAAAGADIVDVKNPGEGSLGAPSPAVIVGVRAAVPAELPVSAAIGDMPNLPGTAALAALGAVRSGATFVKVGLWGVSTEDEAVDLLRAVREGAAGAVVVAAAYADARRVAHAPLAPERLPSVARAAGVGVAAATARGCALAGARARVTAVAGEAQQHEPPPEQDRRVQRERHRGAGGPLGTPGHRHDGRREHRGRDQPLPPRRDDERAGHEQQQVVVPGNR